MTKPFNILELKARVRALLRRAKREPEQAVRWFRAAADQGSARALCLLGDCLLDGTGVPKDRKKAMDCYRQAADLGFSEAGEILAKLEQEDRKPRKRPFWERLLGRG